MTFKDDLKNLADTMTMVQECIEATLEMPVTTIEAVDHLDKDFVRLRTALDRVNAHIIKAQVTHANSSS